MQPVCEQTFFASFFNFALELSEPRDITSLVSCATRRKESNRVRPNASHLLLLLVSDAAGDKNRYRRSRIADPGAGKYTEAKVVSLFFPVLPSDPERADVI